MPKFLTDAQVARYRRDGFLSPITVMSPEEAAATRAALEAAETRWPQALAPTNRNNAHLEFMCLDALAHNETVLNVIEDIIGPDILIHGSVIFAKDPGGPGFVSWHQDGTYQQLDPNDGVTAWIALTPSTPQTGCMRMIPGSHLSEIRPHDDTFDEANILTRGQQIAGVDESKAVDVVLEPGQMSVHNMHTIHGSRPNKGTERRIGFAIQEFIPPHVRQVDRVNYAQVARGTDTHGHWQIAPRPTRDAEPEASALRRRVNAIWSDILYDGAKQRRAY